MRLHKPQSACEIRSALRANASVAPGVNRAHFRAEGICYDHSGRAVPIPMVFVVSVRRLGLWLGLASAGLLVGSALYVRSAVRAASVSMIRGHADSLHESLRFAVQQSGSPDLGLSAFWQARSDKGLTYLAVFGPGREKRFSRGTPQGDGVEPSPAELVGHVARVVYPVVMPEGPGGPPAHFPPPRWDGEPLISHPKRPLRGPGKHPPHPPHGPHPGVMVMEFVPEDAFALSARAEGLLGVAVIFSALILALALAFERVQDKRQALERQLFKERHLAVLGEMSAVLAHELKNPLTSLKGHTQLALESVQEQPKLQRKIQRVLSETMRIEEIVENLLEFVRSKNLKREDTPLTALLERCRDAVERGEHTIALEVQPGLTSWSLDPARVQQVLVNLLTNAIQAQEEPGAGPIELKAQRDPGGLRLSVRDQGSGLESGQEEAIFTPFHTTRTRGTGLGLAICQRIIEGHGGTLTAQNHPDGGAEVRAIIPEEGP